MEKPLYDYQSGLTATNIAPALNRFYAEGYHLKEILHEGKDDQGFDLYTVLVVRGS